MLTTAPPTSSWVTVSPNCDFSLRNIPFSVFSRSPDKIRPRCCTAIGDYVVDLSVLSGAGLLDSVENFSPRVFDDSTLNAFLAYPRPIWVHVRNRLMDLFTDGSDADDSLRSNQALRRAALVPMDTVTLHLPIRVGDYTDFYASREHATNVGTLFRGRDNALQPNWLHLPVGYHGRSSTLQVSGTPVRRPCGQLQKDAADPKRGSIFGPCRLLDFELEMAHVVGGPPNPAGQRLSMNEARERLFGLCLMNDWSARDIQKWEYVPLGPFTAKNFATTVSPWIVTTMALEEFKCPTSAGTRQRDPTPLEYLLDDEYGSFDVRLQVAIQDDDDESMTQPEVVCRSNLKNLYWDAAQMLTHHSVTGCVMQPGDLLGSGTISGSTEDSFGSMLELCWKGARQVPLGSSGKVRKFLEDGDTVVMTGWSEKDGYGRVGFGTCSAKILPAAVLGGGGEEEPMSSVKAPSSNKDRYQNFTLYSFWRSSSTWRVRIALHAKSIPFETIVVNLKHDEHKSQEHRDRNRMAQVPVLECTDTVTGKSIRFTQSVAMIEFLEEAFPTRSPALLPVDPAERARAREMVEIINSGTQPLQNVFLVRTLEDRSKGLIKATEFAAEAIEKGLGVLEVMVTEQQKQHGGPYCLGGFSPSLVDAYLVPQLFNARMFGVDVSTKFPALVKIDELCASHPWFVPAHAHAQPDAEA